MSPKDVHPACGSSKMRVSKLSRKRSATSATGTLPAQATVVSEASVGGIVALPPPVQHQGALSKPSWAKSVCGENSTVKGQ